jgi:hypothetical protein
VYIIILLSIIILMGRFDDVLQLGVEAALDGPFWPPRQRLLQPSPVLSALQNEPANFEILIN